MICFHKLLVGVALFLAVMLVAGCERYSAPPAALSVEELPAAFEKAFNKAKPEIKELATQFVSSIQAKDYSKAFADLQNLSGQSALTKPQVGVTSSALITVNTLLQAAQAQGDAKATETIRIYRENK